MDFDFDSEDLRDSVTIKAFSGLGMNDSDGNTFEVIYGDTENRVLPRRAQRKTLKYVKKNAPAVLAQICTFIYDVREELEEVYGAFDEVRNEGFPDLKSADEVKKYIGISTVYIYNDKEDGLCFFGFTGPCTWDPEHAFGIVLHQDRVVDMGDWDTAYSFYYDEDEVLDIAGKYSLAQPLSKRLASFELLPVDADQRQSYCAAFDWLIGQRALYGFRSTPANLSENEKISLLQNITHLDLSGRKLKHLPDGLQLLQKLTYLSLRNNELEVLPSWIGEYRKLEIMSLAYNRLSNIPASWEALKALKYVDFSDNKFATFPKVIASWTNLENIEASDNAISAIPSWIDALTKLRDLRISDNKLNSLPKSIFAMKNLQSLYAFDNSFNFAQKWLIQKRNTGELDLEL